MMKRFITRASGIAMACALLAFAEPVMPVAHSGSAVRGVSGSPGFITYNWSGYADYTSKPFTNVVGQWRVPTATCLGINDEAHVFWVGLDGWNSGTVEQGGTIAFCSLGKPLYFAWWEMYPTNNFIAVYQVYPGDFISAAVKYSNGTFKISVNDMTTAHLKSFTTIQACQSGLTCSRSSAEWIAEVPTFSDTGGLGNLVEWTNKKGVKTMGFTGCYATSGGVTYPIGGWPGTTGGIYMISHWNTHWLAVPSALGPKGQGFQDYWKAEN